MSSKKETSRPDTDNFLEHIIIENKRAEEERKRYESQNRILFGDSATLIAEGNGLEVVQELREESDEKEHKSPKKNVDPGKPFLIVSNPSEEPMNHPEEFTPDDELGKITKQNQISAIEDAIRDGAIPALRGREILKELMSD